MFFFGRFGAATSLNFLDAFARFSTPHDSGHLAAAASSGTLHQNCETMDLRSGNSFWLADDDSTSPGTAPTFNGRERTSLAIIGGGFTAAVIAHRACTQGIDCILIDKRKIFHGSSAASTGLISYELDASLSELAELIGPAMAGRCYQLSYKAIDQFAELAASLPDSGGFKRKQTLHIGTIEGDEEILQLEYETRKRLGLEIAFLSKAEARKSLTLDVEGALLSKQAAVIDPVRFSRALFQSARQHGLRIFENVALKSFRPGTPIKLQLEGGGVIHADRVVIATGYEAQQMLKENIVHLHSTYAIATNKIFSYRPWEEETIVWDSSQPYYYLRRTDDGRFIIGGCDKPFRNAFFRDVLLPWERRNLLRWFEKKFSYQDIRADYQWVGTFGESDDTLPYIGESPEYPGAFFALGFGGNGMAFSPVAADFFDRWMMKKSNSDDNLFRFGR